MIYLSTDGQTDSYKEIEMVVTRNMTLEQMVETQIRIVATWGQTWTRRQAANCLWFIGHISDNQWRLIADGF